MGLMLALNLIGGTFGVFSYLVKLPYGLDISATMVIIGGFGYFIATIIYYAIRSKFED